MAYRSGCHAKLTYLLLSLFLLSSISTAARAEGAVVTRIVEDYIADATAVFGDHKSFQLLENAQASFSRWKKKSLVLVTIEGKNVDQEVVRADVERVRGIASIVGISIDWCKVIVAPDQSDSLRLPACAAEKAVDIIIAYPKSVEFTDAIRQFIKNLNYSNFYSAEKSVSEYGYLLEQSARRYCLGSMAQYKHQIVLAMQVSDDEPHRSHLMCNLHNSFALLGVLAANSESLTNEAGEEFFRDARTGANPSTALKFLYSQDVREGMTWSEYFDAIKQWLSEQPVSETP
ncbi:hypothetical protein [Dongia rigui]|uniref:Uncharacterized protein n=1 Tax=Dongia rigui TaxID=940149 RepID=A0ABU5DTH9_9PROT|nr:hypothetical protein [Dongia rigui]MDY0870630.1 hypothetical protein [Dongia rigui]